MKLGSSLVLMTLLSGMACAQQLPEMPPGAAVDTPASQPTTKPADAAAVNAVRDALAAYNKAVEDGDAAAIEATISLQSDTQRRMVDVAKTLVVSSNGLYQATLGKFGKETLEQAGVGRDQFPSAFPALPLDEAKVRVEGEKASIRFTPDESGPAVLTLIKVDGAWKLNGDDLLGQMTDQQLKDQSAIIAAVVATMDKTAADVKAGKIDAADEVVVLFTHRVQKAVNEVRIKQLQDGLPQLPPDMGPAPAPATAPAQP